ncbi:MAG: DNA primase DnaG [Nanoarchaeota archaeon]|nr:DNA primase DnaG [Nanoarchaeota archaeon]
MAKVSPVSIKYMIYASFKAEGPLEKPDVIGAIFGQTEGLLGAELEMRELQKEGKIGRIEVNLEMIDGKSIGEILVPTALDKSETTIIAAALETIDRIGPTEAGIQITKIEDVRGGKRDYIIERAKKLLAGLDSEGGEIEEMSRVLKEESRAARIQEYGDEKLPAGEISGSEIIVVEGRADVVNLLKNRVNNVIGMNGTKLPYTIAKLGESKEITLFVDGDRGGKLIAKNVIDNARIGYVAVAPDGKEVEELQGKEILMALRKRVPVGEFIRRLRYGGDSFEEPSAPSVSSAPVSNVNPEKAKEMVKSAYEKIRGTKMAAILDETGDVIRRVSSREVVRSVKDARKRVFAIVIDGTATSTIIAVCDESGIPYLGATNFSAVDNARVKLISL